MAAAIYGLWTSMEATAAFLPTPLSPFQRRHTQATRDWACAKNAAPALTNTWKFRRSHQAVSLPHSLIVIISSINLSAVGGLLLSISYGTKAKQQNDSRVIVAEQMTDTLSESLTPISFLADRMPFLVPFVSPFLSKAAFSKSKAEWLNLVSRFRDDPFAHVQTLVVSHFPFFLRCGTDLPFLSRQTGWLRTLLYHVP